METGAANRYSIRMTAIERNILDSLNELDAAGTEINNLGKKPTETLIVNGYFQELPNDEAIRDEGPVPFEGRSGITLPVHHIGERRLR